MLQFTGSYRDLEDLKVQLLILQTRDLGEKTSDQGHPETEVNWKQISPGSHPTGLGDNQFSRMFSTLLLA